MPDLDRRLAELGTHLEWPDTPDVRPALRARLAAVPARPVRRLRPLLVAAAIAVTLLGGLAASPEARSAILRLLRLRGVTVEQVDRPLAPPRTEAASSTARRDDRPTGIDAVLPELGEAVSLAAARRRAPFTVLVPRALGAPDAVRVTAPAAGPTVVSLLYAPRSGLAPTRVADLGLLVTQFRGSVVTEFLGKLAGTGTRVERVSVDQEPAIWLEGEPHFVFFRDPGGAIAEDTLRLSGNTLLWERDGLLLRLEGRLTRDEALRLATSFDP